MISGWIVVIFWLFVQIYLNLQHSSIENSGLLGVAVPIETGWWVVFMLAGFGILLAWASWGMWPLERFRK
jgi:hypothetical protein